MSPDIFFLREFFKWCSIINVSLLFFSFFMCVLFRGFIHKIHRVWFKLSDEQLDASLYRILGIYKILIIVFNLVPYGALLLLT